MKPNAKLRILVGIAFAAACVFAATASAIDEPAIALPPLASDPAAPESSVDDVANDCGATTPTTIPTAATQPDPVDGPEPALSAGQTNVAEPVAEYAGTRRKPRRKASVEDEWGFFDPDRAGFAALIAKLEEITDEDSHKPERT